MKDFACQLEIYLLHNRRVYQLNLLEQMGSVLFWSLLCVGARARAGVCEIFYNGGRYFLEIKPKDSRLDPYCPPTGCCKPSHLTTWRSVNHLLHPFHRQKYGKRKKMFDKVDHSAIWMDCDDSHSVNCEWINKVLGRNPTPLTTRNRLYAIPPSQANQVVNDSIEENATSKNFFPLKQGIFSHLTSGSPSLPYTWS